MSADESALVRRCLAGEPDAVRALIERFQGDIFGLCVRLIRDRHEAEDVTQEVFLRVFRSLHRWDSTRPLKPWVIGIAVNRCRTWISRRPRRPEPVDYLQETAGRDDRDDTAELVGEISTALADLRPDFRTVFVLFHEHGHSYEDIAQSMGRPVGTVKTWLHRARLELLDRLRQRGMVPEGHAPAETSVPRTSPPVGP